MSRIIRHALGLLLLIAAAGCGNSDKPATTSPEPPTQDIEKQKADMMKFQEQSQQRQGGPPAGGTN